MTTTMNRRAAIKTAAAVAITPPALSALALPATVGTAARHAPFAELTADAGDTYDVSAWIVVATDRYPGGDIAAGQAALRGYCLEGGRYEDGWNPRISPWSGTVEDGDVSGPPLVDVRDQAAGADPLARLRALFTRQAA